MDGDKPLESLFEGLRKMGCNVETGGGDGGFRFSYGGSGSATAPSKEKQERMAKAEALERQREVFRYLTKLANKEKTLKLEEKSTLRRQKKQR